MPAGRPPKWTDPNKMAEAVDAYFAECDNGESQEVLTKKGDVITIKRKIPYCIEGLALALGFTSRQAVHNYIVRNDHADQTTKDRFVDLLTRAMLRINTGLVVGALRGDWESKITSLLLTNTGGYTVKAAVDITDKTPKMGDTELDARINRLMDARQALLDVPDEVA